MDPACQSNFVVKFEEGALLSFGSLDGCNGSARDNLG